MTERFCFATRRDFLIGTVALGIGLATTARAGTDKPHDAITGLAMLEKKTGGRLGVSTINTANGQRIDYRADERFPLCSTFKLMLVGALLKRSAQDAALMQKIVRYDKRALVDWSPITEQHVGDGMQVNALCAAALQHSDNTAANLLMKLLGGPTAVTAYARSIGNRDFRLDRWETDLNTAIPGDLRDTATPASMVDSMHALTLGSVLPSAQRVQLNDWLLGNTTGGKRIRAGVPPTWQVGDKTGSGDYGTTNDIGVLRPPGRPAIVVAIYYTHTDAKAPWNDGLIAEAAGIISGAMDE
ncbi:MAG TPA: class A beta-lactamase [Rhodocyclaceae bacterium]|nr:class A beta-lactamase [Rhodocyclaceae bacterium]